MIKGRGMAQPGKSEIQGDVAFDLNTAVNDAIGACGGDLLATVRSLVVANNFLLAQNHALSRAGLCVAVDIAGLYAIDKQTTDENGRPGLG